MPRCLNKGIFELASKSGPCHATIKVMAPSGGSVHGDGALSSPCYIASDERSGGGRARNARLDPCPHACQAHPRRDLTGPVKARAKAHTPGGPRDCRAPHAGVRETRASYEALSDDAAERCNGSCSHHPNGDEDCGGQTQRERPGQEDGWGGAHGAVRPHPPHSWIKSWQTPCAQQASCMPACS